MRARIVNHILALLDKDDDLIMDLAKMDDTEVLEMLLDILDQVGKPSDELTN